jgi:hypothetical protein
MNDGPSRREPPLRRMKTYTGAAGYVYQYYFVGKRAALANAPEAPATEFIFDVSADRKTTYAVSVFLPEAALAGWSSRHHRSLTEAEQYAAVKMRLFQAFDEMENLPAAIRRFSMDAPALESLLAPLGLDP